MTNGTEVEFYDIFGVILSVSKAGRKKKAITIVSAKYPQLEKTKIYADIRVYKNGISTKRGVYLNEKEYNWVCTQLKSQVTVKIHCPDYDDMNEPNFIGTGDIKLSPKRHGRVKLSQTYIGRKKSINLGPKEIFNMVTNYSTFDKIIDVIENHILNIP